MNVNDFLSRLEGVCKQGNGWEARCPAHEDKRASLSVSAADDGKILVKCQAGCETTEVAAAMGLKMRDLFPERERRRKRNRGNGKAKFVIKCTYDYCDESGKLLFQVCRPKDKDAGFRQRKPNGKGWVWSVKGCRPVPYHLPELLNSAGPVFICEGEKDCDNLMKLGLVATCNAGGAGKWTGDLAPHLEGRQAVVLPDNDPPGRKHADQVAATLQGITTSTKIVELPDLPAKGDASDWLASGGRVSKLLQLVEAAPEWQVAPAAPQPTDLGNSDRFVSKYRADLRYCHPWRLWLKWDGLRWKKDRVLEVLELAKSIPLDVFAEYQRTNNKDLGEWAVKCQARGHVDALVHLARSALPVMPDRLDLHRWLLNVSNGTLDLRTGQRRQPARADYMTTLAPVHYDPSAICPTWDQFLLRIMDGNRGLVDYLQRAVGYSLTGDVGEQCLFFLYGEGANGKSTFLEAIQAAMGLDYSKAAAPNILMATKHESHPTELADLHGARFVSTTEVQEGRRFNEVKLKQLTGGDRIKARRMREDFWEFSPTHKIWLAANHKPVIGGTDLAIWRRVKLIPYTVTIPPAERDRDLLGKLRAELPGILAWAVRGCLEWQREGLQDPPEVLAATQDYRREMDVVDPFIDERCVVHPRAEVPKGELYAAYKRWMDESGEGRPLRKTTFGRRLKDRFQDRRATGGKWMWEGIGLTAPLALGEGPK